jgi:hypothetical protein
MILMVLMLADIVAMARQRKNFDDLMLELSGISGKTPRFLTREQIERIREEAGSVSHETVRERAFREYMEFCDRIQRQLYAVNRAITRALVKSQQRLEEAREALEDIRRRATVDEKGRKVYRTADGTRAFTDDGQQLTSEEMASIQWDPMAPTWEQKVAAEERWKQAAEEHESILRARERADYYSERMASGDLLSRDELEMIHQDLNAMPETVRAEMPDKMHNAMNAPLSEEFALSAEEVAGIRPECVFAPHFPLNF